MSVGQVYGKLETFLSAVQQQQGSTTDPAQGV
jgi:hypothetical protein